jgi:uncharacterized protein RhaS with RHS repeats
VQQYSYNAANQVIGWQYDAAGNLLNDGTNSYTYDPLNRLIPCSPDHFLNAEAQRRREAERQRGKQGQSVFICVHLW